MPTRKAGSILAAFGCKAPKPTNRFMTLINVTEAEAAAAAAETTADNKATLAELPFHRFWFFSNLQTNNCLRLTGLPFIQWFNAQFADFHTGWIEITGIVDSNKTTENKAIMAELPFNRFWFFSNLQTNNCVRLTGLPFIQWFNEQLENFRDGWKEMTDIVEAKHAVIHRAAYKELPFPDFELFSILQTNNCRRATVPVGFEKLYATLDAMRANHGRVLGIIRSVLDA